jgi:hypothetical protein
VIDGAAPGARGWHPAGLADAALAPAGVAQAPEAGDVAGHLGRVAGGLGDHRQARQARVGEHGGEAVLADGAAADGAVAVAGGPAGSRLSLACTTSF